MNQLEIANVLSHKVSERKESEMSLAGYFSLRISQEVAVKLWAGTAVIWRLGKGWGICFQGSLLTCLLAGGLSSSPRESLPRAAWTSSQHGSWLPLEQVIPERDQDKSHSALYDPVSEDTHHHFGFILLIKMESLTPIHMQGRTRFYCLKEGVLKHLWTCFQNSQRWDRLKYIYDLILSHCAKSAALHSLVSMR